MPKELHPINSHELGRKLLEGKDLPVYARHLESDSWFLLYNADFAVERIDAGDGTVTEAVTIRP